MDSVDSLVERYRRLKVGAIRLQTQIQQHRETALELKQDYKDCCVKLKAEMESKAIQEQCIEVTKEIIDKMSDESIEKLVDLLTYGLRTVFPDRYFTVEAEVGDKRNAKTLEFNLVEQTGDSVIRAPFSDGIGGGILAVAGLIMRVYYIGLLKQAPLLVADEAFTQVSSEYTDNLIQFLKELSEQQGFIFVLISHDSRFIDNADRVYRVSEGVITLE